MRICRRCWHYLICSGGGSASEEHQLFKAQQPIALETYLISRNTFVRIISVLVKICHPKAVEGRLWYGVVICSVEHEAIPNTGHALVSPISRVKCNRNVLRHHISLIISTGSQKEKLVLP